MTITTSYFAFESESIVESRREHIMVIWCIALLGLGQQTRGEWSSIKEFINQSEPSLAGEGRMVGTFVSSTSSLVQAPSQCQCTRLMPMHLPWTGPIYWHHKQVAGANINAATSVASYVSSHLCIATEGHSFTNISTCIPPKSPAETRNRKQIAARLSIKIV